MSCLITGCDKARVYEKNIDLANNKWPLDSIQVYNFEIGNTLDKYNIFINIRNGYAYKYSNLYIKYFILDSTNTIINSNKAELFLMDVKTGRPLGDGIGDIYEHQFQLLGPFVFPKQGKYKIKLKQYMRDEVLDELYSVGVRVEKDQTIN